jgi:putative DNA primase/helicase
MLDIDDWRPPPELDPMWEPVACIDAFIAAWLPEAFHGASYHWQLSASAGTAAAEGVLKAHVWLWLSTPHTCATLRAWAKDQCLPIDPAVFHPTQLHYTAAPLFVDGALDPVLVRSGLRRRERDDVPLVIPTSASRIQQPRNSAPLIELDLPETIDRATG